MYNVDMRLTALGTAQHIKEHSKKALKLMKIANITTEYNNIYVIILQTCGKLTLAATHLVSACRLLMFELLTWERVARASGVSS